jgi:hypothetical protein
MTAMPIRKRPHRRKAPTVPESTTPRETELIGLAEDGRMVLWGTGVVRPISRFENSTGTFIKSGHYVIEWKGHAITVHCGNMMREDGRWGIGIQFMCSTAASVFTTRPEAERMLIGEVMRDPEAERRIEEAFARVEEAFRKRDMAPHLQRGRIS